MNTQPVVKMCFYTLSYNDLELKELDRVNYQIIKQSKNMYAVATKMFAYYKNSGRRHLHMAQTVSYQR